MARLSTETGRMLHIARKRGTTQTCTNRYFFAKSGPKKNVRRLRRAMLRTFLVASPAPVRKRFSSSRRMDWCIFTSFQHLCRITAPNPVEVSKVQGKCFRTKSQEESQRHRPNIPTGAKTDPRTAGLCVGFEGAGWRCPKRRTQKIAGEFYFRAS